MNLTIAGSRMLNVTTAGVLDIYLHALDIYFQPVSKSIDLFESQSKSFYSLNNNMSGKFSKIKTKPAATHQVDVEQKEAVYNMFHMHVESTPGYTTKLSVNGNIR